jgi:hypothetical protein
MEGVIEREIKELPISLEEIIFYRGNVLLLHTVIFYRASSRFAGC